MLTVQWLFESQHAEESTQKKEDRRSVSRLPFMIIWFAGLQVADTSSSIQPHNLPRTYLLRRIHMPA